MPVQPVRTVQTQCLCGFPADGHIFAVRPTRPPMRNAMTSNFISALIALDDWQGMNAPRRAYRLSELLRQLGGDPVTLARCLRLNNWCRHVIRTTRQKRRVVTTWWVPPGCRPPMRRGRGRPSYAELFYQP